MRRWLIALVVLLLGRLRRRPRVPAGERIVEPGVPDRRAENLVLFLFGCVALSGAAFPVIYGFDSIPHQTQFLGLALGLALAFIAAACVVIAMRLVVRIGACVCLKRGTRRRGAPLPRRELPATR